MSQEDNRKKLIIGGAVIAGAALLYYLYSQGSSEERSADYETSKPTSGETQTMGWDPTRYEATVPLKGDEARADDQKDQDEPAAAEAEEEELPKQADTEQKAQAAQAEQPAAKPQPAAATYEQPPKTFRYRDGILQVFVDRAANLEGKDSGGLSDPYVELTINGKGGKKTKTIQKNLNPVWQQSFSFPVKDAVKDKLIATVWDKDKFSTNDKIGSVEIPVITICAQDGVMEKNFDLAKSKGTLRMRVTYAEPPAK